MGINFLILKNQSVNGVLHQNWVKGCTGTVPVTLGTPEHHQISNLHGAGNIWVHQILLFALKLGGAGISLNFKTYPFWLKLGGVAHLWTVLVKSMKTRYNKIF